MSKYHQISKCQTYLKKGVAINGGSPRLPNMDGLYEHQKNIKKNMFYPLFLWWQKLSQPKRSDGTRGPWAPLASGDDPAFGTVTKNPGFFLADFQETIWKSTVKYNGNVPRMFHSCKIGMFFNVRSKSQIKVNLAVDTASPSSNLGSPFFHVMARSFTPSPPPGPQDLYQKISRNKLAGSTEIPENHPNKTYHVFFHPCLVVSA